MPIVCDLYEDCRLLDIWIVSGLYIFEFYENLKWNACGLCDDCMSIV